MTKDLFVDLADPRFGAEKYSYIEDLRAQSFFARTAEDAVVFFNAEDVRMVFRCEEFRFAFHRIDKTRSPYLAAAIEHELLNMHAAAHDRLSRLLKQALRDRILEGMRATIEGMVDDLIAAFPQEGTVEFCAGFADPLPARVLGPMFGVPYDAVAGLNDWIRVGGRKSDALQSGVDIDIVEDANRKIHTYLRGLLAERRTSLGDDLFSELILAEIDGDRMSEDELVYLSSELASAGVDTTRTQLPLILLALLEHPEEMQKLRADPKLALRAVDEGMRFAPLPWVIPHMATRDFDYKGIPFRKGDIAFAFVPAANRDPSEIDEPHCFDITRQRARHFSFGYGMHACPGAQLARMEMAAALHGLVTQLDEISLAAEPERESAQGARLLATLPLKVRKKMG